jgi:hypothetical protein
MRTAELIGGGRNVCPLVRCRAGLTARARDIAPQIENAIRLRPACFNSTAMPPYTSEVQPNCMGPSRKNRAQDDKAIEARQCMNADGRIPRPVFHRRKVHPSQTSTSALVILSPACSSAAGSHHAKDLCSLLASRRTHQSRRRSKLDSVTVAFQQTQQCLPPIPSGAAQLHGSFAQKPRSG